MFYIFASWRHYWGNAVPFSLFTNNPLYLLFHVSFKLRILFTSKIKLSVSRIYLILALQWQLLVKNQRQVAIISYSWLQFLPMICLIRWIKRWSLHLQQALCIGLWTNQPKKGHAYHLIVRAEAYRRLSQIQQWMTPLPNHLQISVATIKKKRIVHFV